MIDEEIVKKAFDLLNGFSTRLDNLEKEYSDKIKNLRVENAHIKNERYYLKNQIEKMKCCENCINYNEGDCESDHFTDCKHWNNQSLEDYWEMKK